MLKQFFDFGSKTFRGTMLGLLAIALVVINMYEPASIPKWVIDAANVAGLMIVLFGWSDIAKGEAKNLSERLQDWIATSPAIGAFFQVLALVLDNLPQFKEIFPPVAIEILTAVSYILIAMGVRKMMAGARLSAPNVDNALYQIKYRGLKVDNDYLVEAAPKS